MTDDVLSLFGVDSSGKSTGWAEVQWRPEIKLIRSGQITVIPLGKKLDDDYEEYCQKILDELLKAARGCKNKIYSGVIEEPPFFRGSSARNLIGLAQFIRISFFNILHIPVNNMSCSHAKKLFTGDGHAPKELMISTANKLFGTSFVFSDRTKLT